MKISTIIHKLKNKFQKSTTKINYGSYGCILIKSKSGELSGHFWGDINEVTPYSLTKKIIELFDNKKVKNNWSEEEYKKQLLYNLELNSVHKYYIDIYIKQKRKEKLDKIMNKNNNFLT